MTFYREIEVQINRIREIDNCNYLMNSLGQGGQSEATRPKKSRVPVTLSRIAMKKGRSARN